MLTYDDCVHFSELDDEEITSIARAEHLSIIAACGRGKELADNASGCRTILKYLLDNLESAEKNHNLSRTIAARQAFNRFATTHHYI